MSVICPAMLDVKKLKAPPEHGQVLVAPQPKECAAAARHNAEQLQRTDRELAGAPLSQWRRQTRQQIAGTDDAIIVVVGHQPEFFHPGVWAKHIAAARLARALQGQAINLVVDNDAVHRTVLPIPAITRDQLRIENIRYLPTGTGLAYEQIAAQNPERLHAFRTAVRTAMGDRYEQSLMPTFFDGLDAAECRTDWVEQMVAARSRAEAELSVTVSDRRVSGLWLDPFLSDILIHTERFAAAYNRALESYRQEFNVRGANQPIPDLHHDSGRCEAPFWAFHNDQPRRRLFVEAGNPACRANEQAIHLFAEGQRIGSVPQQVLEEGRISEALCLCDGWNIRPRALTLTLWARLLLADLFIHGIGGARYDRISDAIIADYYGVHPPPYACVTATLWLDLPRSPVTEETVRRARHDLRDLAYNPQRHLSPAPDIEPLLAQRRTAVEHSRALRDSEPADPAARRRGFETIRQTNAALLAIRPEAVSDGRTRLRQAVEQLQQSRIARNREYFFGLFDRNTLKELLDALPDDRDFRV